MSRGRITGVPGAAGAVASLTQQFIDVARESGLSVGDVGKAFMQARDTLIPPPLKAAPVKGAPKFAGPILRPGGKFMGKERRRTKEAD